MFSAHWKKIGKQVHNIIKVYPMLINVTLRNDYRSITNQKQTDAIELEHFIVEGVSGGGHYAATCAYIIPDWLSACGIIAGTGPIFPSTGEISRTTRTTAFISCRMPWVVRLLLWKEIGRFGNDPEKLEAVISKMEHDLPEQDQRLFREPEIRMFFIGEIAESFRQGTKGPAFEGKILFGEPRGFELEDISMENCYLWHGEMDANIPVSIGCRMAERIPHCQARFYPDEAYLSLLIGHADEFLATLGS